MQRSSLIMGHVVGSSRESELNTLFLELSHDAQIDPFAEAYEGPVIRWMVPVDHHDIQGGVVELIEIHPGREIRVHAFVVVENLSDNVDGPLNLFQRGIIGDGYVSKPPYVRPAANILNIGAGHLLVWNRNQVTGEGADPGGAKADFFHHTIVPLNYYPLTNSERFVQHDHYASEEILQRIL